ncbi:MAG: hypothetical protein L3J06_07315 [Cyclobacteriaceae bacterium]|nr:hypothetical protein [Cyclobacteriaceae bacterium]
MKGQRYLYILEKKPAGKWEYPFEITSTIGLPQQGKSNICLIYSPKWLTKILQLPATIEKLRLNFSILDPIGYPGSFVIWLLFIGVYRQTLT